MYLLCKIVIPVVVLILSVLLLENVCDCGVIVSTTNGKLRGTILRDINNKEFYSFQAIPYAKPPLGPLRFKSPELPEPWHGVLNATGPAPMCLQFEFGRIVGQEDCLYLNIYTPQITSDEKMAVMFYIHGGAYFEGSGSYQVYGPEYLVSAGIVLVTIDYRLGRFGSLSFEDQSLGVPGNAHLKDQLMALKWVQNNIEQFGGDKNRVTIFGESVGGASVHMHMLSPLSKGLFHRAISQGGISITPWNYGILNTGKLVAKTLGIQTDNINQTIRQLQELPVETIMETQSKNGLGIPIHTKFEYSPVVEKQTNEPAFLPDTPIKILESGNYSKVPYILGYNDKDTYIFQVVSRLYTGKPFYIEDMNLAIPHDLNLKNEEERAKVALLVKNEFFGNSSNFSDVDKFTDLAFGPWGLSSYHRLIIRHLKTSESPFYFYVLSADTKLNFFKRLHPETAKLKGASHIDELGYLFKTKYTPTIEEGSIEAKARNNVINLWTNFAKHGNPTPANNSLNINWLPVTKEMFHYLDIGHDLKLKNDPNKRIVQFWHSLYAKYNGDTE